MTDWAAKVLADVPRYRPNGDRPHAMATDANGRWLHVDDALAAIARMGAGDGLVERLNRADEYEPLGHDGWEAAAHIAALTAQNREMALDVLASSGQAQEAYAAQLDAEARISELVEECNQLEVMARDYAEEAAALRERVARLEGALTAIDALDPEGRIGDCSVNAISGLVLRMGGIARAALTDGGKDG